MLQGSQQRLAFAEAISAGLRLMLTSRQLGFSAELPFRWCCAAMVVVLTSGFERKRHKTRRELVVEEGGDGPTECRARRLLSCFVSRNG
jgi:hypothetical protein